MLAAFTWLAYRILRRFVSPAPAVTSCAAFLVLCAFALYATYSSFDLIAPYSHEVSHGLLIAAVGLVLVRGLAEQKVGRAVGVGVCVGLALLTKPEIALAVGVSLTAGVCLTVSGSVWTWKRRLAVLTLFAIGSVLPAAAFGAGYAGQGIGWLREAVIGPWRAVANPDVRNLAFYRKGLGINAPGRNLLWMGLWSIL